MQNGNPREDWKSARSTFARMSSVIPSTDFVRKLGTEIGRTAREKMGYGTGISGTNTSFEDRVIDLRRWIRLLRETLVPVQPRQAFRTALNQQLQFDAIQVQIARQNRWRWLVIGSAVGSALSLLGVLTALLLRQRQTRPGTNEKTLGAT